MYKKMYYEILTIDRQICLIQKERRQVQYSVNPLGKLLCIWLAEVLCLKSYIYGILKSFNRTENDFLTYTYGSATSVHKILILINGNFQYWHCVER